MNKHFYVCTWVLGLAMAPHLASRACAAEATTVTRASLAEVQSLFRLNGNMETTQSMLTQMVTNATTLVDRAGRPQTPDRAMLALRDSLTIDVRAELPGFLESMERLYASHFTRDEIRELIAFYKTPIGQRLAHETPIMASESLGISQQWASRVMPKIQRRVKSAQRRQN